MQLPSFTARSALLYLIGVAAFLVLLYLLVLIVVRVQPRKTIHMQPGAHAVVLRLAIFRPQQPCARQPTRRAIIAETAQTSRNNPAAAPSM
ncbi:MAG: hypothetical protein WB974_06170 [Acidobacteriaceae bacterium]